ncbi:hypothetical protein CCUS01_08393 [Colletotrichum cuscutae]|uniref:Uncharacterized protein n=1 Tax=Colletotrichum cuscutae TaxID=1209917 RepID=A0AAI9UQS1_9PEZI|nr:hypothetical protein CCUS01_08393 [Colletotrichum cuscutae]
MPLVYGSGTRRGQVLASAVLSSNARSAALTANGCTFTAVSTVAWIPLALGARGFR